MGHTWLHAWTSGCMNPEAWEPPSPKDLKAPRKAIKRQNSLSHCVNNMCIVHCWVSVWVEKGIQAENDWSQTESWQYATRVARGRLWERISFLQADGKWLTNMANRVNKKIIWSSIEKDISKLNSHLFTLKKSKRLSHISSFFLQGWFTATP